MNKIFLIEDLESVIDLYEDFFTLKGYELIVSKTAEEFDSKVSSSKPDLIIYDTDMPTQESDKFLQLKNSLPNLREIPLLLLTGFIDEGKINKFKNVNYTSFLNKDSSLSTINRNVENILRN